MEAILFVAIIDTKIVPQHGFIIIYVSRDLLPLY